MSSPFVSSPVWSGMWKLEVTFNNYSGRSCKKEETAEMRVLAADTLAYLIEVDIWILALEIVQAFFVEKKHLGNGLKCHN